MQSATAPADVIVQAAGSLPGDLHKLWRVRDPLGYHVEYAFSCMGYEIAGGLGVKRGLVADGDDRDVVVMVGDGSYLMLSSELATAVAEGIKLIVVLIQNHGYASIGHLSETVGSERFGTAVPPVRRQDPQLPGRRGLPVDLAMNARSYGLDVIEITPGPGGDRRPEGRVAAAKASDRIDVHPHRERPAASTRPTARAGGTCRFPRCRHSSPPSAREPSTRTARTAQRPLLGDERSNR